MMCCFNLPKAVPDAVNGRALLFTILHTAFLAYSILTFICPVEIQQPRLPCKKNGAIEARHLILKGVKVVGIYDNIGES
jgi:hypothetical protein